MSEFVYKKKKGILTYSGNNNLASEMVNLGRKSKKVLQADNSGRIVWIGKTAESILSPGPSS